MREAQKEYKWKLDFGDDRQHLARRLHHPRALPPEDHRGLPTRIPNLVNLLLDPYFNERSKQRQANWREVVALAVRARHRRARVQERAGLLRRLPHPRGSRPTSSRPSAITSARTPTSASTSRAGSSSTSTGRNPSARSSPSDRPGR